VDSLRRAMREIANHVLRVSELLNEEEVERLLSILVRAREDGKKVLVVGAGRSGLVARAFAMRLMHLGFNVYVLGETITPSISDGDVVIAVSGSGRTQVVVSVAAAAKRVGATVVAITSYPSSPLGRVSNCVVRVPGRTKIAEETDYFARQVLGIYEPLAPLGTLFEDTVMVFFDGLIVELMGRLGITEEEMRKRHANVEGI